MAEEEGRVNGFGLDLRRGSSDWGPISLLDKTKEFFQTCDVDGNGFITRTDMRVRYRVCVCVYCLLHIEHQNMDSTRKVRTFWLVLTTCLPS